MGHTSELQSSYLCAHQSSAKGCARGVDSQTPECPEGRRSKLWPPALLRVKGHVLGGGICSQPWLNLALPTPHVGSRCCLQGGAGHDFWEERVDRRSRAPAAVLGIRVIAGVPSPLASPLLLWLLVSPGDPALCAVRPGPCLPFPVWLWLL